MKKNVLITGGTGFVGKHLTALLIDSGYSVSILSRTKKKSTDTIFYYTWDVEKQLIENEAVLNADFVIHLAGENIAGKRWSKERKEAIISSREESAKLIYGVVKKYDKKLDAFISASGVGIYGAINGQAICVEDQKPANDFLGLTCQKWEAVANQFQKLGIRTVKVRTGLVVGPNDGFLEKLKPLFKYRLGSALGTGTQYMPWIHIDDLCAIYLEAIQNADMSGAYNAAINDNTTNASFSATFAQVYGYKIWLPNVPAFIMKVALGEMAKLLLTGRRVSNEKIKAVGFTFKWQKLDEAIKASL
ncbi:TIGR01777 family oxidoreductase [Flavobacterium sp.]|uniref:TIGR01777 family oxidoreductase n=1 Tax=Flavobacterium sp. TaxID=239 RepID=UPI0026073403|nr:TIGR01777 family oxidoreductase [Flavobacterium sp.]MDG2432679.1 TIGR01777 family oxidoreductase [Flavobacterium sp.]